MPVSDKQAESREVAKHFLRQVVPIWFDLRKGRERHQLVYTAFILSVRGKWLLLTAGHCLAEMERYRTELGYTLERSSLFDSLGPRPRFSLPVPFDYDAAKPRPLCRDPMWDYGALILPNNTLRQLLANDVAAFDEEWWETEPEKVTAYYLLGVPDELTAVRGRDIHIGATMVRIEALDERPDGFEETDAPMFYGRLVENPISSLKGFSGGPIISVAPVAGVPGGEQYRLHAMQVSALKGTSYVSAVLMRPFAQFLQGLIDGNVTLPEGPDSSG